MIVLDASVVIKWFQEERDSERAVSYQAKHSRGEEQIVAPDLLLYELINVLRYQKGISDEAIDDALEVIAKLEIQIFTFSPLELKEVFRFARISEISAYDALYVVLAKRLGCGFVTADKKLYHKLQKIAPDNGLSRAILL